MGQTCYKLKCFWGVHWTWLRWETFLASAQNLKVNFFWTTREVNGGLPLWWLPPPGLISFSSSQVWSVSVDTCCVQAGADRNGGRNKSLSVLYHCWRWSFLPSYFLELGISWLANDQLTSLAPDFRKATLSFTYLVLIFFRFWHDIVMVTVNVTKEDCIFV